MKKYLTPLLTAALVALATVSTASAADPSATLPITARDHVIVDADVIRLGDLFTNAGEHAEKSVAYAPDLGSRAVFDLNWLYRVAKAYKLDWRPAHRRVSVVVERASQQITRSEVADYILAALVEKGADPDLLVDISNRSLRLYVPSDQAAMVGIEEIRFDKRTRRFTAIVMAPADDPRAKRVRVTGQAHKMVEVPVLTRRIIKDDVITKGDVTYVPMRADRVQADVILTAEDLIGKTARRAALRDGEPIRARNVRRPLMVKKGSLVTMVMHVPNMTLTSKGKALEDGSDGDTIRVTNSQSRTTVETVVTGTQRVSVMPAGRQLALAN